MFQFFASDERIKAIRKMIMAITPEQRKAALDLLLPYQRSDFEGIFRAMDGIYPCIFSKFIVLFFFGELEKLWTTLDHHKTFST